ncbi:MAG TPA: TonB-dependent receptor plug domain-containing protein [Opitutaceae bacterium]|nr:TonB-dependent receptor plug domain-containing protein [Opitutaceae bacterium]
MTPHRVALPARLLALVLLGGGALASAQSIPSTTPPAEASAASDDAVITLNPFQVTTSKDKGYKATNATSGTRLDTAIKDLPMPIEVITKDFIRDIGADSGRDSLRYSAGVQLQSQNDYRPTPNPGLSTVFSNAGGVNNPQGMTADQSDSVFVIRGFLTENTLRDGFRRTVTMDSADIDRIEVVRGPAALLYGTGNFGGVVDYIQKRPEDLAKNRAELAVGSYGYLRFTGDSTGPVVRGTGAQSKFAYRLNFALQQNHDVTQFYSNDKAFVAPMFVYRPWAGTEITLDTEFGRQHQKGIGFQSLRARADIQSSELDPTTTGGQERFERAVFITFPGESLRTMRWSGPDTSRSTTSQNLELKFTQRLTDDLHLLLAYNASRNGFRTRDILANATNSVGPASLWATLNAQPLSAGIGDSEGNGWYLQPVQNAIVQYEWTDVDDSVVSHQARADLSYQHVFLKDHRWLATKTTLLLGLSTQRDTTGHLFRGLDTTGSNPVWNYKSVIDPSPFKFGTQGDGTPDQPIRPLSYTRTRPNDRGLYAVYNGQFLDGKLTLLGGFRSDRNSLDSRSIGYSYATGATTFDTPYSSPTQTTRTKQFGVSVAPIHAISFYAEYAEGFEPNFAGERDLTGRALTGITAKNREFGVKFDLLHGRISGTISHYDIKRDNVPFPSQWWYPQTAYLNGATNFNPNKATVYKVSRENPDAAQNVRFQNGGSIIDFNDNLAWWGPLAQYGAAPASSYVSAADFAAAKKDGLDTQRAAIQSTWAAAKAAGAVTYWNAAGTQQISAADYAAAFAATNNGDSNPAWAMVNASTPQGAAYLDAVYGYSRAYGIAHPGTDNFPGWFFGSAPAGTGYNSAVQDSVGNAVPSGAPPLVPVGADENRGWDGQIIVTPVDEWQILFSFTINNHTINSLGQLPTYPYQSKDRWAQWMFPNSGFGLKGVYGPNQQYRNEADTSTYQFSGYVYSGAQGEDFPKRSWNLFTNYKFDRIPALKGFVLGGGVRYLGPREYASGYTAGGGRILGSDGTPVVLYTPKETAVDLFARYEFKRAGHPMYAQLNVNNLLNDQHRYGNLYAPGRTIYFRVGSEF